MALEKDALTMAKLRGGIRIVEGERFAWPRALSERLSLNSGVCFEGENVYPRTDWRTPGSDELALLTGGNADACDQLVLIRLSERLVERWWELAASHPESSVLAAGAFDVYAGEVMEFLSFKQVEFPSVCRFEARITAPGLPSIHQTVGGLTALQPAGRLVGGINLSDEESALVILNLTETQLSDLVPTLPASASLSEKARVFLTHCSDYPQTRISLAPGEGFWLPSTSVIVDGDNRGREQIDVQLVIRAA
jgi:hypothetical protein